MWQWSAQRAYSVAQHEWCGDAQRGDARHVEAVGSDAACRGSVAMQRVATRPGRLVGDAHVTTRLTRGDEAVLDDTPRDGSAMHGDATCIRVA